VVPAAHLALLALDLGLKRRALIMDSCHTGIITNGVLQPDKLLQKLGFACTKTGEATALLSC
jgi:hypothetical protein